jgi:hypothetical protein
VPPAAIAHQGPVRPTSHVRFAHFEG